MSAAPLFASGKPHGSVSQQKLFNARLKERLRWIVNPLEGLHGKKFKSFHVRHEASMIELFFDLFFVANLATFTSYHEITTSETLLSYIGFFVILWSTWFQITIFDVRFAADSVFERFCKLYQFVFFVMLAVVGFSFAPGSYDSVKGYRIYQTVAIVMGVSRFLLAIQYAAMAFFIVPKHKKLATPFALIFITLMASGAALFATFKYFNDKRPSRVHEVWWIVLPLESIVILVISSVWRMLSFKESHMAERLSLLTMIIIGEGVIGSTKTAGALWPTTSNPSVGGVISIVCIIIMLMLMWQLYFDNHPHGHYGTIKQQWWAFSHFFLHIGFVGTVEGSNRMAIFYNANRKQSSFGRLLDSLCLNNVTATTPQEFVEAVNATVQKLKIEKYDPRSYDVVQEFLNHTLPGSDHFDTSYCDGTSYETTYSEISYFMFKGIYARFDIAPPEGKKYGELDYAHTFRTTFIYLWSSVALSMLMLLIFLWIVRTKKRDLLEYFRLGFRLVLAIVSFGIGCLIFSPSAFQTLVTSPYVVMLICILMLAAILFDRLIRILGVRNFKKRYAIPPPEAPHGNGDGDHAHPGLGTPHESYKMGPSTTVHPYPVNTVYAGVPQAAPQGYSPHNPQAYAQTTGYSH